ncbi:hypothetical protein OAS39_08120 [Pirellulales bacterium]|nr:hypothetical protein [Pirellulales bacterium]
MRVFPTMLSRPSRRGSLYIPVLGVALIVSAMGMSAMVTARLNLRGINGRQDRREARILADSALELAAATVMQDGDWRTNFVNNVKYPATPLALGNGTITWKLVDQDGDLSDDVADPVRLTGVATVGQSIYTASVLLEPAGAPLRCLESSLHSNGQFWMWDGVTVSTDQTVSTNSSIYKSGSGVIAGDGEAAGSIQSGSVSGTATQGASPRKMPAAAHVFDYYLNNGTWIDIADVPGGSPRLIEKVVLSPGNNPYGAGVTNPQGIYVIDCKNQNLRIKLVRLSGTLVLLNTGSGSDLDNDQHWEPAIPNFPVLLVDGDIVFNWHGEHALRESMAGVNYNPAHTPYQGQSDVDQTDEYPALIKGLIYVSGNLDVQHECVIEGVVVTDAINPQANISLAYDSVYLDNPPPGFRSDDPMAVSLRSWRREVSE